MAKKKTTIVIELEIRGDSDAVDRAIEAALNVGILQDWINDYKDDEGPLRVVSAVRRR